MSTHEHGAFGLKQGLLEAATKYCMSATLFVPMILNISWPDPDGLYCVAYSDT